MHIPKKWRGYCSSPLQVGYAASATAPVPHIGITGVSPDINQTSRLPDILNVESKPVAPILPTMLGKDIGAHKHLVEAGRFELPCSTISFSAKSSQS